MKGAITFFIYFRSTILKAIRPGGTKSIIAENLAIKQQLIIIKRKSKILKSPRLTPFQRIFFSFLSFFMSQDQIKQIAVILSPNTIFRFHQLLIAYSDITGRILQSKSSIQKAVLVNSKSVAPRLF